MTDQLLSIDRSGDENPRSMFRSEEERDYFMWLTSLEVVAPGTVIFRHRLSDGGHYLCTVPCPYSRMLDHDPDHPKRYCGCFDCIDTRKYLNTYIARAIIPNMEELIPPSLAAEFSQVEEGEDVLGR